MCAHTFQSVDISTMFCSGGRDLWKKGVCRFEKLVVLRETSRTQVDSQFVFPIHFPRFFSPTPPVVILSLIWQHRSQRANNTIEGTTVVLDHMRLQHGVMCFPSPLFCFIQLYRWHPRPSAHFLSI